MCLTKKWIKKWEDDFAKNINASNYSSEHYKKIIVSSSKMTSKLINKSHSNWRKHKKYQYLYLQQKLDTRIEHENYYCEMYDCWHDTSEEHDRISFYYKWLIRINKKYNYA
tara:strand:- start:661 stop:993 length:333 start_codon:yes stop_codon:yes gene_type:complete